MRWIKFILMVVVLVLATASGARSNAALFETFLRYFTDKPIIVDQPRPQDVLVQSPDIAKRALPLSFERMGSCAEGFEITRDNQDCKIYDFREIHADYYFSCKATSLLQCPADWKGEIENSPPMLRGLSEALPMKCSTFSDSEEVYETCKNTPMSCPAGTTPVPFSRIFYWDDLMTEPDENIVYHTCGWSCSTEGNLEYPCGPGYDNLSRTRTTSCCAWRK